jgi:CheY-like chemotaxis protein
MNGNVRRWKPMNQSTDILIVEDRGIIAAKIKRELHRAGLSVAGMAATQAAALKLAGQSRAGAAILDIDLGGQTGYPVAEVLRSRGIPFVFLTGYSHVAVPPPWQDVPLVEKPFEAATLIRCLHLAMAGGQVAPAEGRMVTPVILESWDRVRHLRDLLTEQRAWSEQYGLSQ